ncbi:hypothetical protein TELCIR_08207 [Teladorsagia circumcincta]|uniref:Uncharacterized protein n=1 Tax=Teladorsagia circumcincta TaxID=45464 RepID=A0A2G9UII3_TELCI|nr:hypothetical protein TELCIR_08207 [Teladorsagia circumcincta]
MVTGYNLFPPCCFQPTGDIAVRERNAFLPQESPGKEGDRDAYRVAEKVTEAGPGSAMPYRAGFGRGAPPPQ